MSKLILFVILFNLFETGYTQTIKGTVLDKSNNVKISFASVYISGTNMGTSTDQKGYFELDITKYKSLPLTISALGYYSVTLTSFATDKTIQVYLAPKTYELNEVVIAGRSRSKERESNLRLFRSQFLGSSVNGRKCVIINEKDIMFVNSGNSLKAFASKPILILNNGLGYKITYYLDSFEFDRESGYFLYKGNAIFDEDLASVTTGQKKIFEKRRRTAYLGSIMHLFSSLWSNSLESNGFDIRTSEGNKIYYKALVMADSDSKKYLRKNADMYIFYSLKPADTRIELLKDNVFFDSVGYFDGSGVKIIGRMAQQRIGDLLPFEYKIK